MNEKLSKFYETKQKPINNNTTTMFNNNMNSNSNDYVDMHNFSNQRFGGQIQSSNHLYKQTYNHNNNNNNNCNNNNGNHKSIGPQHLNYPKQRYTPYVGRNHHSAMGNYHHRHHNITISSSSHQQHNSDLSTLNNNNPINDQHHQQQFTDFINSEVIKKQRNSQEFDKIGDHHLENGGNSLLHNNNNNSSSNLNGNNNNNDSSNCSSNSTNSNANSTTTTISFNPSLNQNINNLDSTNSAVTLQISNLDISLDEGNLKQYLLSHLKPITPIISFCFEGCYSAKVKVPSLHYAKQVVSYLHRKRIGHKRIVVSYTRESSSMELSTLRCQVAGLLKDIPHYKLSMYKFRELFQSRFKTSIGVLDLYKMQDICNIIENKNDEKYISLRPELISSIVNSDLMECLQHSIPYCVQHFITEKHRGWAEQEMEPLPNVFMSIAQIRSIMYPLLRAHKGDIPITSLVYCIEGELKIKMQKNDNGVNLEHLVSCINGIQIVTNKFGIKILDWLQPPPPPTPLTTTTTTTTTTSTMSNASASSLQTSDISARELFNDEYNLGNNGGGGGGGGSSHGGGNGRYSKLNNLNDPFYQISREVIELVKAAPKSTLKFNRFIPAYHNHFGKQCRVADYGYTRLIDLLEALSSVIQVMGDGENRQITLTHRTQIRRFTSDLLRILRAQTNKTLLLSQLARIFSAAQMKPFDITEYGVCDIEDILDGLVNSDVIVLNPIPTGNDVLIAILKRKQTTFELDKTFLFAGEMVELIKHAPQYTVPFEKLVRSYHYHFGYQLRLCDYGFSKLVELMDAIAGVIEMEFSNDEDRKICLSPKIAQRVFAEQLNDLVKSLTGVSTSLMTLDDILNLHKNKYGYQIQPQILGYDNLVTAVRNLPFIELLSSNDYCYIICHHEDNIFRSYCYVLVRCILDSGVDTLPLIDFMNMVTVEMNEQTPLRTVEAMKHLIEISIVNMVHVVTLSPTMQLLLRIIHALETKNIHLISELKHILNLSLNNFYDLGYPNLYSLVQAFPDIFQLTSKITHDKSEVKLIPNCVLIKKNPGKHHNDNNNVPKNMTYKLNEELSKNIVSNDVPSQPPIIIAPTTTVHQPLTSRTTSDVFFQPNAAAKPNGRRKSLNDLKSTLSSSSSSSSSSSTTTTTTTTNTISDTNTERCSNVNNENKSNKMKYNQFMEATDHQYEEHISAKRMAYSNDNYIVEVGKYSAKYKSYNFVTNQSQNVNSTKLSSSNNNNNNDNENDNENLTSLTNNNVKLLPEGVSTTTIFPVNAPVPVNTSVANNNNAPNSILHNSINHQKTNHRYHPHQYLGGLHKYHDFDIQNCTAKDINKKLASKRLLSIYFDPPKPDTPPVKNIPFWLDPVWNDAMMSPPLENLNIKLPDLKPYINSPKLNTPTIMGSILAKQQQDFFKFDKK